MVVSQRPDHGLIRRACLCGMLLYFNFDQDCGVTQCFTIMFHVALGMSETSVCAIGYCICATENNSR